MTTVVISITMLFVTFSRGRRTPAKVIMNDVSTQTDLVEDKVLTRPLFVTPRGERYHEEQCRALHGRGRLVTPCLLCRPRVDDQ